MDEQLKKMLSKCKKSELINMLLECEQHLPKMQVYFDYDKKISDFIDNCFDKIKEVFPNTFIKYEYLDDETHCIEVSNEAYNSKEAKTLGWNLYDEYSKLFPHTEDELIFTNPDGLLKLENPSKTYYP